MKAFRVLAMSLLVSVSALSVFPTTALAAEPIVLLNFTVLRNRLGQGNTDYVNRAYLNEVAAKATSLSLNRVRYQVNSVTFSNDDKLYYQRDENKTLKALAYKAEEGHVNVIYSNDDTYNTGRALITGDCCEKNTHTKSSNKYRYHPTIILHSRIRNTSPHSVRSAARLILHELGHHIGFHHKDRSGINGDNYYKTESTIPYHVSWAIKMQQLRSGAGVGGGGTRFDNLRFFPHLH